MGQEEKPAEPVLNQGSLFCLNNDLTVSTKINGSIDISNGISWTSDHKTMYYTDSLKVNVFLYFMKSIIQIYYIVYRISCTIKSKINNNIHLNIIQNLL